jgi:predicted N-acyltransferase
MRVEAYHSEIVSSINNVNSVEWNQVISDAASISYEVLEFSESNAMHGSKARYFLLRDQYQCLQAVSIALCISKDSEYGVEGALFGRLLEKLRVFKNCLRPALICGLVGHGAPVKVRSGENEALWISRILDVMETYARGHQYSIGFSRILSEQEKLIKELVNRGYCHAYGLPEAKISINWNDESSYLKNLRSINKNYYKCAKKEINRFRKSGASIQEWEGGDAKALTDLLKKHHNERNQIKSEIHPESLSDLKFKLKDNCKVYLAKKEKKIIGVAILLKKGRSGRAWIIGVDHIGDDNKFTYFNLAYYNILIDAPSLNLKSIWYGPAALQAKIRRGCEVELTEFYYKPRLISLVPIYFILLTLQRFWYKHKFSDFMSESNAKI